MATEPVSFDGNIENIGPAKDLVSLAIESGEEKTIKSPVPESFRSVVDRIREVR